MPILANPRAYKCLVPVITDTIRQHLQHICSTGEKSRKYDIYSSLKNLLNGNFEKYEFNEIEILTHNELSEKDFQKKLANLNEKQATRKHYGVYYTPEDVVSFVIKQTFSLFSLEKDIFINKTIFDPTCGAGEFLLFSLKEKLSNKKILPDDVIIETLSTIYGNDINIESVEITKIRLFFETIKHINNIEKYENIVRILNENITCFDFINVGKNCSKKFDIVVGNPPYIEDNKSAVTPTKRYGNVFANVIHNSMDLLSSNGIIAFIIPISYISTPRMSKIRKYVENSMSVQYIANYADRPDCLFTSVHQKLSILLAKKGKSKHKIYTTGYNHWYKSEREQLFSNTSFQEVSSNFEGCYPKIANSVEMSIFNKLVVPANIPLLVFLNNLSEENIYLNMRACFWIKAFAFNPGSNEYKGFCVEERNMDFILCLLNSSLFYFFWIATSDCWHITLKELTMFRIPDVSFGGKVFSVLRKELEDKLEKTKIYIGTRQTNYEYKHKYCKDIIDNIDDNIAKFFNIHKDELEYIKAFSSKYRESLGAI